MPRDTSVYVTPKSSKSVNVSKNYNQSSNRSTVYSRNSSKTPKVFDSKKSGQIYLEMDYNQKLQDYLQELDTSPKQKTKYHCFFVYLLK